MSISKSFLMMLYFFLATGIVGANEDIRNVFKDGVALNNQAKLVEAIPYFEKVIAVEPDFAPAYFELAYAHDYLEQKDKAIEFYEKGLKYDPKFFPAYIRLALCYVQVKGDLGRARYYAKEALKLDPNSSEGKTALSAIEDKIRSIPGGSELLNDEEKYAKKGVGIYQSGDFTFVGPVKKGETIREDDSKKDLPEEIELAFDKRKWNKKVDIKNSNPQITQYFLEREDPANWTEVVTVHTLKNATDQFTPNNIANKLTAVNNPKMNIISQSKSDLMYDGFSEEGKRYELVRVIFGKERIHTLYYASRNMKTVQGKKREWVELLKKAKIIS